MKSGKGICYDYAALLASMARNSGIPAKLVMGKADAVKTYHSWNEVWLDGSWKIIDTTVDANGAAKKSKQTIYKSAAAYHAEKIYLISPLHPAKQIRIEKTSPQIASRARFAFTSKINGFISIRIFFSSCEYPAIHLPGSSFPLPVGVAMGCFLLLSAVS